MKHRKTSADAVIWFNEESVEAKIYKISDIEGNSIEKAIDITGKILYYTKISPRRRFHIDLDGAARETRKEGISWGNNITLSYDKFYLGRHSACSRNNLRGQSKIKE